MNNDKIIREEILRYNTRKSLDDASSKPKNKIIAFFNSPLGLWFLSSVLLAGLGWGYSKITAAAEVRALRESRIERLDIEIESTISSFLIAVEEGAIRKPYDSQYSFIDVLNDPTYKRNHPQRLESLFYSFFKAPKADHQVLDAEFKDRTTMSLIFELSSMVESDKEQMTIRNAAFYIFQSSEKLNDYNNFLDFWKEFRMRVLLPRWQTAWPYTDCGEEPFC